MYNNSNNNNNFEDDENINFINLLPGREGQSNFSFHFNLRKLTTLSLKTEKIYL